PDLTLILDAPATLGLGRAAERGSGERRFEAKDVGFHERLREAFLAIAAAEPARCVVVNATLGLDEVADAIWRAAASRIAAA
ncbi:MAG: thymidylate kinase, partial [Caulobacteraceae bacterium]|nr:thymidylate kinase [Caulobacteraceae bacterium]